MDELDYVDIDDNLAKEINDLFMNESDKKALELLYNNTGDTIVKIMLNWLNTYDFSEIFTPQYEMFDDMISYIYEKYAIDRESD